MKIEQRRIELVNELLDKTINFPQGLPGFETHKRFVLVRGENEAPFFTLRSLENPSIGLTVVEPHALVHDYRADVSDLDLIPISSPLPEEIATIVVVVITQQENQKAIHIKANLKVPIVINTKLKLGAQVPVLSPNDWTEEAHFEFPHHT